MPSVSVLPPAGLGVTACRDQVEEGQTVLVMNEPDLSEDMDGWTEWYKHITEAVERLKMELDERF